MSLPTLPSVGTARSSRGGQIFCATPFRAALVRSLPFLLYMIALALEPVVAPGLGDERWWYLGRVGLAALALVGLFCCYGELTSREGLSWRNIVLALAAGLAVFVTWINVDQPGLTLGKSAGFMPVNGDGSLNLPMVFLRLCGASLVVPLMEELFWRSFLLRWFDRGDFVSLLPRQISAQAILLCAIPFGLEHHLWFAGIVAGVTYGVIYRQTGNLWLPILAHAVTNFCLGAWIVAGGHWSFW